MVVPFGIVRLVCCLCANAALVCLDPGSEVEKGERTVSRKTFSLATKCPCWLQKEVLSN